jgi:hypothetical protein
VAILELQQGRDRYLDRVTAACGRSGPAVFGELGSRFRAGRTSRTPTALSPHREEGADEHGS